DLHAAQQIRVDFVTRFGLGGARTPVERLDSHPPHQRLDAPAAGLDTLGSQETSQHPCPRERKLQMQLVQPPHDGEVSGGHRTRQGVDAAAADAEGRSLLCERQSVFAVDHRFALSRPAFVSAPSKKSFSSVSSPIFACRLFKSTPAAGASLLSWPNTPAAPSRSWPFHWVI